MLPSYPEPRNLLKGKTVVVTAAAGTGIGFSAAKRATEEGATVLISDFHQRRLGEAADRIADEVGTRPATFVCDVTQQDHVDGLRKAALQDDAQAWMLAWQEIDNTRLAELLRSVKAGKSEQLTLCGERTAVTLETQDKPWWGRIQQRFSTASSQQLLQTL